MKGRKVEKQYRRVTDIDEKIKNVSLPYFHWKVLFLVLEETNINELVNTLSSDRNKVEEALNSLEQNGILEIVDSGKESKDERPEEIAEEEGQEEFDPVLDDEEESQDEDEEIVAEIISESEEELDDLESSEQEKPMAEFLDEAVEEDNDDVESLIEEKIEQESEVLEQESDDSLEESIEEEFTVEDAEEETTPEESIEEGPESEDINFESFEETAEVETKEDEESADISSLIDEMGSEEGTEESEQETMVEEEEIEDKPKEADQPEKKSTKGSKTVMVIDDSIVIRKMVEIALEDGDYHIVTSSSGKEGLTLVDEENPDIVIVDMTLPDMNGIDLLKTVKASKGIPVIMLSGKDAPQLIENAKAAGADDFLPKPFRDDDLIEKVKNLLK
jgi:CheY-like chemotaxis protein